MNNVATEKLSKLNVKLIHLITLVYFSFLVTRPTIQNFNEISLILFSIWIIFAFLSAPSLLIKSFRSKAVFVLSLFLLFIFFTGLFSGNIIYILKQIAFTFLLFSPYIIFRYFRQTNNENQQKFLLYSILIIWSIIAIKACIFYLQNYHAARYLASNIYKYGTIYIGSGYAFANASSVLIIFLINMKFKLLNLNKLIYAMIILCCIPLIILTESTITVLSVVLGIVIGSMWRKRKSSVGNVISMIIILTCCLFLLLRFDEIGNYLILLGNSTENIVLKRISDIGIYMTQGSDASNQFELRLDLIRTSWSSFLKSPLIGVGYKYGYFSESSYFYGVGNHSEFFDCFAKYGIIGCAMYFSTFYYIFKDTYIKFKINYQFSYIITFIFLALFNPFDQLQSVMPLFILIPLISQLSSSNYNDEFRKNQRTLKHAW